MRLAARPDGLLDAWCWRVGGLRALGSVLGARAVRRRGRRLAAQGRWRRAGQRRRHRRTAALSGQDRDLQQRQSTTTATTGRIAWTRAASAIAPAPSRASRSATTAWTTTPTGSSTAPIPTARAAPSCRPVMGTEICDNHRDDNGDGLVDCTDPQCTTFAGCLSVRCQADVDFGTLARARRDGDQHHQHRRRAQCLRHLRADRRSRARRRVHARRRSPTCGSTSRQAAGSAHVVSLFRAGANQACDQNLVYCLPVGAGAGDPHLRRA